MKAAELKDDYLQKIRFDAAVLLTDSSKSTVKKQFRLRLNEIIRCKPNPLITQTEDGVYNSETKVLYFPRFDFTSDISMSTTPVH
jgi:hypothetical protein